MEPITTSGLLPIPERRRRRLRIALLLGVIFLVAGWVLEIGFVWGLGAGFLIAGAIALLLDTWARRRGAP